MQEFKINVSQVEELQTLKYTDELDKIFKKAATTLVGGEKVILVRGNADGSQNKFDEISTLEDLATYKDKVFKYL
jgi:hypothetical protein